MRRQQTPRHARRVIPARLRRHNTKLHPPAPPAIPVRQTEDGRALTQHSAWVPGQLRWQGRVPLWQRRGIIISGPGSLRWAQIEVNGGKMLLQVPAAASRSAAEPCEVLLHANEILALKSAQGSCSPLQLDRLGAGVELLRREWMLSLFLFGPVLGVFLVNLIFGMPSFLWWTALGVFCLSIAIMAGLLRRDLQAMQSWLQSRRKLWAMTE